MATTTQTGTTSSSGGARVAVQKFGTFLSGMIMPNIGAFIAWGLITALFIEKGWLPVDKIGGWGDYADGGLVGPMVRFLLPILIAVQGGRMIYGTRGAVVGGIATMGAIMATTQPMFLGAMIFGPLAAWLMKKVDALWDGKIKPGFEMLVNNFSAGILGAGLAVFGLYVFGPIVDGISNAFGNGVNWLIEHSVLPLASVIIEPAKVLFLNNAINHGVLTPLGIQQSTEQGKSILFLLEANPGPGAGLLLAFCVFGVGMARSTAPAAFIIQFFGGIHEIYFPYVLMKPVLILATIAGGMVGILTLVIFNAGLVGPAAPGSIIAVMLATPGGSFVGVILSVVLSAATSFIIASVILRGSRRSMLAAEEAEGGGLAAATSQMEAMKGKKSSVSGVLNREALDEASASGMTPAQMDAADGMHRTGGGTSVAARPISKIVFACDAGMGSSAMGASVLRNKIKKAGFGDVSVTNVAIANLTDDIDLIVTQETLTPRAKGMAPSAEHVSVSNFMNSPRYDEIVSHLRETNGNPST
ncbi:PTS mannitol transporter subunit IICB [Nakamurella flava]|uniref:PTS system mannitol-specific EIICB component n=1 Tax=Nakamurella flava TaxID=2576308 RepID=A0A4V6CRI8_9ACTN|nr:PTS mannitol transporter subunit IICB [Nakamurella flava]TKV56335.1 PTS mannitol transporter subunit IICB [Nakamurella flava]